MRKLSFASETKHILWTGKIQNSLSMPTSSQAPICNCKIDKLTRQDVEFLWKVSKTFKLAAWSSRFVFRTPKWNYRRKMGESSAIGICQNNFAKMTHLPYIHILVKDRQKWRVHFFLFFCYHFVKELHFEWKFQLVSGLMLQLRGCSHPSVMQIVDCNSANFSSDKCAGLCVLHTLVIISFILVQTSFCREVVFESQIPKLISLQKDVISNTIWVVFEPNTTAKTWCLSQTPRFF